MSIHGAHPGAAQALSPNTHTKARHNTREAKNPIIIVLLFHAFHHPGVVAVGGFSVCGCNTVSGGSSSSSCGIFFKYIDITSILPDLPAMRGKSALLRACALIALVAFTPSVSVRRHDQEQAYAQARTLQHSSTQGQDASTQSTALLGRSNAGSVAVLGWSYNTRMHSLPVPPSLPAACTRRPPAAQHTRRR